MGDTNTVTATTTTTTVTGGNGIKRITPSKIARFIRTLRTISWIGFVSIVLVRFVTIVVRIIKDMSTSRYVYKDVIKRPDFQKHFDCSGIQGYVTNKNKVLFLKRRRDNQQVKEQQQNTKDHRCNVCNHALIDASYCSIQCKVSAITNKNTEGHTVDDNVLHIVTKEPTLTPSKNKRRKGLPYRAPLF
ncbi:hypothetical protein QVD17_29295 [Tagetes erecta]|uniref:Uncharacterized protein n=1 Tax=Tagetes erecta TaxID=13708 RepID=A0AAD8KEZ6_TARER|nr:hypothetical protein QVD17_29295 [Tagetes erecta]